MLAQPGLKEHQENKKSRSLKKRKKVLNRLKNTYHHQSWINLVYCSIVISLNPGWKICKSAHLMSSIRTVLALTVKILTLILTTQPCQSTAKCTFLEKMYLTNTAKILSKTWQLHRGNGTNHLLKNSLRTYS